MASEDLKKWLPIVIVIVIVLAAIFLIVGPKFGVPGAGLLRGMGVSQMSPSTPVAATQSQGGGALGGFGSLSGILPLLLLGGGGALAYNYRKGIGSGAKWAAGGAWNTGGWLKEKAKAVGGMGKEAGRGAISKAYWSYKRRGKNVPPVQQVPLLDGINLQLKMLDDLKKLLDDKTYATAEAREIILRNICGGPLSKDQKESNVRYQLGIAQKWADASKKCETAAKSAKSNSEEYYISWAKAMFYHAQAGAHYLRAWCRILIAVTTFHKSLLRDIDKVLDPTERDQIQFAGAPLPPVIGDGTTYSNLKALRQQANVRLQKIQEIEVVQNVQPPTADCFIQKGNKLTVNPTSLMAAHILPAFVALLQAAETHIPGIGERVLNETYLSDKYKQLKPVYSTIFSIETGRIVKEPSVKVNLTSKPFWATNYRAGMLAELQTKLDAERTAFTNGAMLYRAQMEFAFLLPLDYAVQKTFNFFFTFETLISSLTDEPAARDFEKVKALGKAFDNYVSSVHWSSDQSALPTPDQLIVPATEKRSIRVMRSNLSVAFEKMCAVQKTLLKCLESDSPGPSQNFFESYFAGLMEFLVFMHTWGRFDEKYPANGSHKKKSFLKRTPETVDGSPLTERYFSIAPPQANETYDLSVKNERALIQDEAKRLQALKPVCAQLQAFVKECNDACGMVAVFMAPALAPVFKEYRGAAPRELEGMPDYESAKATVLAESRDKDRPLVIAYYNKRLNDDAGRCSDLMEVALGQFKDYNADPAKPVICRGTPRPDDKALPRVELFRPGEAQPATVIYFKLPARHAGGV